jgi:hypothetical protein
MSMETKYADAGPLLSVRYERLNSELGLWKAATRFPRSSATSLMPMYSTDRCYVCGKDGATAQPLNIGFNEGSDKVHWYACGKSRCSSGDNQVLMERICAEFSPQLMYSSHTNVWMMPFHVMAQDLGYTEADKKVDWPIMTRVRGFRLPEPSGATTTSGWAILDQCDSPKVHIVPLEKLTKYIKEISIRIEVTKYLLPLTTSTTGSSRAKRAGAEIPCKKKAGEVGHVGRSSSSPDVAVSASPTTGVTARAKVLFKARRQIKS